MAKNPKALNIQMPVPQLEVVRPGKTIPAVQSSLQTALTLFSLGLIDLLALLLALGSGFAIRIYLIPSIFPNVAAAIPPNLYEHIWWIALTVLACLIHGGLYLKHMSFWQEAKRLVVATTMAFLIILAVISLGKLGGEVSRFILVTSYLFVIFLLPLFRYLGKNALARIGWWNEPLLIMGAGEVGKKIAAAMQQEPFIGYKVVGFLEDNPFKRKKGVNIAGVSYCILGGFSEAEKVLQEYHINRIIIAAPGLPGPQLVELTTRLKHHAQSVMVIPDLIGIPVAGGEVEYMLNDQIIAYQTRNNLANPVNRIIKFLFDKLSGLLIFILVLPLLLILALLVRLDSSGSAIYSGYRLGYRGKKFKCYKFRTMYLNNDQILEQYLNENPAAREEWEVYAKLRSYDPRVTRIGKYLRQYSLDELPQILNVIRGQMSLVGPRPYLPREIEDMGDYADTILMIDPGMTGLWQVSGRNEIDFNGRLELEASYVRNWSIWLDISLLFRTFSVVLGRKGAY